MIIIHSVRFSGTVRNTFPPNSTMNIWPISMITATLSIPSAWRESLNTEWLVPKTLALNRFQNWSITKIVKKQVRAHSVCEAGSCLIPTMSDISITKNASPTPNILLRIALVMIKSLVLRGFSFITSGLGGMEASAMAAKVSIMRFTHNIWVTVSGSSVPRKAPSNTLANATTLIVSWKTMKRWMFL